MIDDVGSISEETGNRAEGVATASARQTASIVDVAERIQHLSTKASDLRDLLEDFDVRGGRDDASGARSSEADPTAADGGPSL